MKGNTLNDAIRAAMESRLADLHVSLPGRVESYNMSKQIASVKPLVKKKLLDGSVLSMEVLSNVPVIMPRTAAGSLTFPIARGDYVLLLFAERAIDNWMSLGGEQLPGDPRKHDLSDAIAIPGLFPSNASASPAEEGAVILECGGSVKVKLKGGKVAIGTPTTEVLAIISSALNELASATTATQLGPQPLSCAGALATLRTQIDLIKGTI